MKTALLLASLLLATPAFAQGVVIDIHFAAPPPLVLIAPGIQVVPDYDGEVFFATGYYWTERSGAWYRTTDHRGGWAVVGLPIVPVQIVEIPRGKYKHHHHDHGKHDGDKKDKGNGKGKGKGNKHGK